MKTRFLIFLLLLVANRYQETILRQKRISDLGAQQLLLDTYNVKAMLLHLHHAGGDSSVQQSAVPAMYMKLVTSRVSHVETILKLLGLPDDILVDRFRAMWPEGTLNDLQTILSLRGLKKLDQQQPYFDQFNALSPQSSQSQAIRTDTFSSGDIGQGDASGANRRSSLMGMSVSVRSLTQDLSSTARTAVGDLRKVVSQKYNN